MDEATGAVIGPEELDLAARNHALPLEALRYDTTPAGLHYLLIHYDIPDVDPATWRLEITGAVATPLTFSLEELRERPRVSAAVTLECAGNGRALLDPRPISQPWLLGAVGNAEWTGTPLAPLLRDAGVSASALEVAFAGADHGLEGDIEQDYERGLPLTDAMNEDVLLADEMNGLPLPPQHGFPLRLVVPGWYGMTHVKWLRRIDVLDRPFDGYQNATGYRMRSDEDDPGRPVERIRVRSLLIPPGYPSFQPRARHVDAGPVLIRGRAWSGSGAIDRVAFSADGGRRWTDAVLGPEPERNAWRAWHVTWDARPGAFELCCRATDTTGATQPMDPEWNVGGYANNAVQRVPVEVAVRPADPT